MPRTATGPNGEKLVLEDGQWVPVAEPGALPGKPSEAAAKQDDLIRQGMKTFAAETAANVIGLPHAAGELLALGAAGVRTAGGAAVDAMRGKPLDLSNRFQKAREYEENTSFAGMLTSLPEPSGDDLLRLIGSHPAESDLAASAGRAGADIATLLSLRPAARVESLLKSRAPATVAEDSKQFLDRAAEKLRPLIAGGKKVTGAGFEGALVGALGDGDPANTAAWSAGIQAGGSLALAAKGQILKHPFKSFGTLWLGHEMFKSIAPGPQNAFESKDTAVNEMVGAYVLGVAASLAGAKRGAEGQRVIDAMSRASRAGIASVVTQLQEVRDQPHYQRIIEKVAQDPEFFGDEIRIRLERAANSDEPKALLNEIDRLMDSTRFRRKFDELTQ